MKGSDNIHQTNFENIPEINYEDIPEVDNNKINQEEPINNNSKEENQLMEELLKTNNSQKSENKSKNMTTIIETSKESSSLTNDNQEKNNNFIENKNNDINKDDYLLKESIIPINKEENDDLMSFYGQNYDLEKLVKNFDGIGQEFSILEEEYLEVINIGEIDDNTFKNITKIKKEDLKLAKEIVEKMEYEGKIISNISGMDYLLLKAQNINESNRQIILKSLEEKKDKIYAWREILPGNDSFFRSIIFTFLEGIILSRNKNMFRLFLYMFDDNLKNSYFKKILSFYKIEPFRVKLYLILIYGVLFSEENSATEKAHSFFIKIYNAETNFDPLLILNLKFLIYQYLKANEKKIYSQETNKKMGALLPNVYKEGERFKEFYENNLLQLGKITEQISILVIPFILRRDLFIYRFEGNDIKHFWIHTEGKENQNFIPFRLIYFNDSYFILYEKNYFLQFKNILNKFSNINVSLNSSKNNINNKNYIGNILDDIDKVDEQKIKDSKIPINELSHLKKESINNEQNQKSINQNINIQYNHENIEKINNNINNINNNTNNINNKPNNINNNLNNINNNFIKPNNNNYNDYNNNHTNQKYINNEMNKVPNKFQNNNNDILKTQNNQFLNNNNNNYFKKVNNFINDNNNYNNINNNRFSNEAFNNNYNLNNNTNYNNKFMNNNNNPNKNNINFENNNNINNNNVNNNYIKKNSNNLGNNNYINNYNQNSNINNYNININNKNNNNLNNNYNNNYNNLNQNQINSNLNINKQKSQEVNNYQNNAFPKEIKNQDLQMLYTFNKSNYNNKAFNWNCSECKNGIFCENCILKILMDNIRKRYIYFISENKKNLINEKPKKNFSEFLTNMIIYYPNQEKKTFSETYYLLTDLNKNLFNNQLNMLKSSLCLCCLNYIKDETNYTQNKNGVEIKNTFLFKFPCGCIFCSEKCLNEFLGQIPIMKMTSYNCACGEEYNCIKLKYLLYFAISHNLNSFKTEILRIMFEYMKNKCCICNKEVPIIKGQKNNFNIFEIGDEEIDQIFKINKFNHLVCNKCSKSKDISKNKVFYCKMCSSEHSILNKKTIQNGQIRTNCLIF